MMTCLAQSHRPNARRFGTPKQFMNGRPTSARSVKATICMLFLLGISAGIAAAAPPSYFEAPYLGAEITWRPNGIAVGLFNADNIPDLAIANSSYGVSVLLGIGNGVFQPHVDYDVVPHNTSNATTGVACADFNLDGYLDLAVAMGTDNTVSLLFGNGNGTFVLGPRLTTASYPYKPVVADLNEDGLPDVVAPCWYGNAASVLLNIGGSLVGAGVIPAPNGCSTVAAGDLNGDGHADLAVTDGSGGLTGPVIHLVLGDGDGTFGPPQDIQVPSGFIYSVYLSDMDGDGDTDLGFSTFAGVTLYRGDGQGGLEPAVLLGTGDLVWDFAFVDLNGDGNRDLVASGSRAEFSQPRATSRRQTEIATSRWPT
jgi:hypothetical protein